MTIVVGIIGDIALIGIAAVLWEIFRTLKDINSQYTHLRRSIHDVCSTLNDVEFAIKYPDHTAAPAEDTEEDKGEESND